MLLVIFIKPHGPYILKHNERMGQISILDGKIMLTCLKMTSR